MELDIQCSNNTNNNEFVHTKVNYLFKNYSSLRRYRFLDISIFLFNLRKLNLKNRPRYNCLIKIIRYHMLS